MTQIWTHCVNPAAARAAHRWVSAAAGYDHLPQNGPNRPDWPGAEGKQRMASGPHCCFHTSTANHKSPRGTGKKTRWYLHQTIIWWWSVSLHRKRMIANGEGPKSKGHVPRISYAIEPKSCLHVLMDAVFCCVVFLMYRWLSFSFVPRCFLVCLFTKILSNEMLFSHQPQNQKQHRSRRLRGRKTNPRLSWRETLLLNRSALRTEACVMRQHRERRNALHPANCWHLARIKALMQLKC